MPNVGHVIDCAYHLRMAHEAYKRMVTSGDDGNVCLKIELRNCTKMDDAGRRAASAWANFLKENKLETTT